MKPNNKPPKKPNFRIDEVALVFVVVALAFAVGIYEKSAETAKVDAREIADIIFDDHSISFVNNGVVNENKLEELRKMDYTSLKNSLNAKNDFCIYMEDSKGNVIVAKGSSKLKSEVANCAE